MVVLTVQATGATAIRNLHIPTTGNQPVLVHNNAGSDGTGGCGLQVKRQRGQQRTCTQQEGRTGRDRSGMIEILMLTVTQISLVAGPPRHRPMTR